MSPHKSVAKKSAKCPHHSPNSFRNDDANITYLDHYKNASIVMERSVYIESLENTFILEVFKERTWTKFLKPTGDVYECIIKEFFAYAFLKGDHINCWARGREFIVSRESIQELLKIYPMTPDTSLQYDARKEKLEPFMQVLGGQLKKKALHTINFTPEMRALAYIMIFNLHPVKNLTTLSRPRTIFLDDLFTHKEIDICGHIYLLFIKCFKKRKSRLTLPFPILAMSLISRARVKIPSGLLVMQREEPISEHTIIRSKAHIPGLETGASKIPRDEAAAEDGNIEDEINHFTHVLEHTPQPSSQAQARAPNCLDFIRGKVEEMHAMLISHIDYSTRKFTYLKVQITALSSQIQDLEISDLESNTF